MYAVAYLRSAVVSFVDRTLDVRRTERRRPERRARAYNSPPCQSFADALAGSEWPHLSSAVPLTPVARGITAAAAPFRLPTCRFHFTYTQPCRLLHPTDVCVVATNTRVLFHHPVRASLSIARRTLYNGGTRKSCLRVRARVLYNIRTRMCVCVCVCL